MKLIFVTPEFVTEPYFSGGIANYYYKISKILVSKGHDVTVLIKSEETPKKFDYEGIKVIRFRSTKLKKYLRKITLGSFHSLIDKLDASYSAMKSLKPLNYKGSIVEIANYEFLGLIPNIYLKNKHFVTRIQSSRPHWDKSARVKPDLSRKIQWFLEYFQVFISKNNQTTSNLMKEIYEKYLPIKNITVLKRPVLENQISCEKCDLLEKIGGKPYILYFGRLQYHKGVDVLAYALLDFFKQFDDIVCVFVGNDSTIENGITMKSKINFICKKFENRLIFFPAQKHDSLYPLIKNSFFVVLPSIIENASNAQYEAMSLGKVVLGSTRASFDEVISDGINGFLFENGDSNNLAKKMIEVAQRDDLEEIGNRAKEKMKNQFNENLVIDEILKYYESIR